MNLQETLEAMLDKRRQLVGKLTPAEQSRLLHEGLGNLLEQSLYAQGMTPEETSEQQATLRSLAGCILYLLHPEDELAQVTLKYLDLPPRPSPAGSEHKPGGILIGEPGSARPQGDEPLPEPPDCAEARVGYEVVGGGVVDRDAVVYRKGDGTYRRKPRPDRG